MTRPSSPLSVAEGIALQAWISRLRLCLGNYFKTDLGVELCSGLQEDVWAWEGAEGEEEQKHTCDLHYSIAGVCQSFFHKWNNQPHSARWKRKSSVVLNSRFTLWVTKAREGASHHALWDMYSPFSQYSLPLIHAFLSNQCCRYLHAVPQWILMFCSPRWDWKPGHGVDTPSRLRASINCMQPCVRSAEVQSRGKMERAPSQERGDQRQKGDKHVESGRGHRGHKILQCCSCSSSFLKATSMLKDDRKAESVQKNSREVPAPLWQSSYSVIISSWYLLVSRFHSNSSSLLGTSKESTQMNGSTPHMHLESLLLTKL